MSWPPPVDPDDEEWWQPVERLIAVWSANGRQQELDVLLPGWRANTGLTDGWADAVAAVEATASLAHLLPEERSVLRATAAFMRKRLSER